MTPLLLLLTLGAAPAEARLSVGLETLANVSLTQGRTQGGVGGALGVAWAFDANWQAQARVAWLWGLGSHTLVRVGAGWQRGEGTWRPLVRADLALGLGGALDFGVAGSAPSRAPTLGLVLGVSLLRFQLERVTVSLLELEVGLSTEFLSIGPRAGLGLLAVSVSL